MPGYPITGETEVVAQAGLILASASPRRKQLLQDVGLQFTVKAADIDESRLAGEEIRCWLARVAERKARVVAADQGDDGTLAVLAADTCVVLGEEVFGKPENLADAIKMWQALSGRVHQVMTSVCLQYRGTADTRIVVTEVEFDAITESQMQRYWQTGEPVDKAGAYAIQGIASAWVKLIRGSYSNVVGLPLREVNQMLCRANLNWM